MGNKYPMKTYVIYIESEEKLDSICDWLCENMPTATAKIYSDGQFTALHLTVDDDMYATIMELKWF